jgi:hypothetical protein
MDSPHDHLISNGERRIRRGVRSVGLLVLACLATYYGLVDELDGTMCARLLLLGPLAIFIAEQAALLGLAAVELGRALVARWREGDVIPKAIVRKR